MRTQAITDATTAALIISEERASLPTLPSDLEKPKLLEQNNKDEFIKKQQQAKQLIEAMKAAENRSHPPIQDSLGVSKAQEKLQNATHALNTNAEKWTLTYDDPATGRPVTKSLANCPEFKEAMERLKKLSGINVQTLTEAIKKFNKSHEGLFKNKLIKEPDKNGKAIRDS